MASNPPNATLYLRNIDESIKIPALIEGIRNICSELGEIEEIVAKKNLRARGQAFVVFTSVDDAEDAMEFLQGAELFGRKLVVQFAKSKSDAVVRREGGEEALERHKKERLALKERRQALQKEEEALKQSAQRSAAAAAAGNANSTNDSERPPKTNRAAAAMLDENLPPNKMLVLRDLPKDFTPQQTSAAFAQFPGFVQFRPVPGRNMGFADYEDENAAAVAREGMNGSVLGDATIKVTFQKPAA
ncbi:related to small nuclear ribonucleoprotein snRNP U1A [Ramularia collo-cygni]|uniref:Related to small nuclear ribonucleoprotein snRNP U1A n=1 Tax=Ramularia collo-cygni TaxID=112498 RepID=A0A2D3V433_9PEZI|nr:related to small nuclear ribonucleoprotein snRNP U1A [Ramularia collo-cygni]CZT20210.1 related to small nuclear ribonucleoprotein snRNP U1A [Ramularia collo-cygni]